MDKRGAELSMNVIIISILVILVLVIVAAFFTGGASKLFSSVRDIFGGATAGTDRALAVQNCNLYCEQYGLGSKAYCTKFVYLDTDNSGEADYVKDGDAKVYNKYYCNPTAEYSLNIPCNDKQGNSITC